MWMCSNRLQLNANKTEFIWISSSRRPPATAAATSSIGTLVAPLSVVEVSRRKNRDLLHRHPTPSTVEVSADLCRDPS